MLCLCKKRAVGDYTKTDMQFFDPSFKAVRYNGKKPKNVVKQSHNVTATDKQINILTKRFKG